MLARLGSNAFERYQHERGASGLTVRRHIGWRWPCDCSTFARAEGDYLWVACREHDVERAAHGERAPHRSATPRAPVVVAE
jgi:hypothetical protein